MMAQEEFSVRVGLCTAPVSERDRSGTSHTRQLALQLLVKKNIWRWRSVLLNKVTAVCGSLCLEKVLLIKDF